MRLAGGSGVVRGRKPHTTVSAKVPDHRPDLANRDFIVEAPNQLWGADITYVRLTSGFCYTASITDALPRKIAGWATSCNQHKTEVLQPPIEPAQYVSICYTDHLTKVGMTASVGSAGEA